ncbi:PilW family protein [Undibacterium sp. Jales W-56]|uniref:PilW family protein n=1 Tax=Undibacterium sp. Jales W-56 TaxID=2897325 RepID=UPI0021D172CE|nr:PilW family protein [Undibacterium sp. Jales W-56]MCU6433494.1 PilW family protein [Undibacterium sp. Jales W-56]
MPITLCCATHNKDAFVMAMSKKTRQYGLTLVELMVAITLGLIVVAGLSALFVNNSRARSEIERVNQQIDNGRYAMQLLTDDLRSAGYFGEFNPKLLASPATKPDPCSIVLSDLKAALPLAIQGYDNGVSAPSCVSDVRTGTDIVVVRRASTCAIGETDCDAAISGAPYFQASTCSIELAATNPANYYALDTDTSKLIALHKNDCTLTTPGTIAPLRQYRTHIYFIANNDKPGDGIPTLKRAELGVAGGVAVFTIVPLVEGIENLQIEYGIDTIATPPATTGNPALFTADPDSVGSCAGTTCIENWRNVVAAKVHVLARNTTQSTGYSDNKTYTLGLLADGTTANTVTPPTGDHYRRHLYKSVVRLNNTAGRNTP